MIDSKCAACKFWVQDERARVLEGECHLSPPQIVPSVISKDHVEFISQFVRTFGDMWCGQYQEKSKYDRQQ